MSLDQCADQYVLALAPDANLALSPRADDPDSWVRREARGHRRIRPTLEAAVSFRPEIVVRYWGGDPALLRGLARRGVRVVEISDATDIQGVRANVRQVAQALGQPGRGQALVDHMDRRLAQAAPADGRSQDSALYMTAGGFTAGTGTLIDAMITAAGVLNLAGHAGFGPVSVERIVLDPPTRFVFGFLDQVRSDWRGPGRHPVIRRIAHSRPSVRLPAAVLTCPAWFVADGVALIGEGIR